MARDDMEFQREQAEEARRNEAEQRKKAGASLYYSRISQSQLQWRVNDFPSAKQSLANCLPEPGEDDHRGWEWHYLQSLFHNDLFTLIHPRGRAGGQRGLRSGRDRIASVVSGRPSGETTWPAEVRIWDARTGDLMHAMTGPSNAASPGLQPRRQTPGPGHHRRRGHDLGPGDRPGNPAQADARQGRVMPWPISPDGQDRRLRRLRTRSSRSGTPRPAKCCTNFRGHEQADPERRLPSAQADGRLGKLGLHRQDLGPAAAGKEPQTLRGHEIAVYCVAFSPDGKSVVSAAATAISRSGTWPPARSCRA